MSLLIHLVTYGCIQQGIRRSTKNPLNNILNPTEEELSEQLDPQGGREKKRSCKA